MMFIQCFIYENNNCIPYEPGFKLTRSLEYKLLEKVQGYNPLTMMINYALTGRMTSGIELQNISPLNITPCYNISCLLKPGKIAKIEGIEDLKNIEGIIDIFGSYNPGDILSEDTWGKLTQIGFRIFLSPKNEIHYKELQEIIKRKLKCVSEDN